MYSIFRAKIAYWNKQLKEKVLGVNISSIFSKEVKNIFWIKRMKYFEKKFNTLKIKGRSF